MKKYVMALMTCLIAVPALAQDPLTAPTPIAALADKVWIEDMTWMEVRDAIKAGKTTVIIGTGCVEQNGPHVVNGKSNLNVRLDAEAVAKRLGNVLLAPIVTIGPADPEFLKYPGSFGYRPEIFKAILTDMSGNLKGHGFKHIILMGDNGGNEPLMKEAAAEINAAWGAGASAKVIHLPEYYGTHRLIDRTLLPEMGIKQVNDVPTLHSSYRVEALLMLINPEYVRLKERMAAKRTMINGISVVPADKTIETAKKLFEAKTVATADAIKKATAPGTATR